jgi:hypothetical protein
MLCMRSNVPEAGLTGQDSNPVLTLRCCCVLLRRRGALNAVFLHTKSDIVRIPRVAGTSLHKLARCCRSCLALAPRIPVRRPVKVATAELHSYNAVLCSKMVWWPDPEFTASHQLFYDVPFQVKLYAQVADWNV